LHNRREHEARPRRRTPRRGLLAAAPRRHAGWGRDAGPYCDGGFPEPTPDDDGDLPTGCVQVAPGVASRHGAGAAVGLFGLVLALAFVARRRGR
jgi:hypothetical protein